MKQSTQSNRRELLTKIIISTATCLVIFSALAYSYTHYLALTGVIYSVEGVCGLHANVNFRRGMSYYISVSSEKPRPLLGLVGMELTSVQYTDLRLRGICKDEPAFGTTVVRVEYLPTGDVIRVQEASSLE